MTPLELHHLIIAPCLIWLSPPYDNDHAARFLVAAAWQESRIEARRQTPRGPARSYWQIEPATACDTLRRWPQGQANGRELIGDDVKAFLDGNLTKVAGILTYSDLVACVVARGILWLDRYPLPVTEHSAWVCYAERTWRPGKPRPETWPQAWRLACEAVPQAS